MKLEWDFKELNDFADNLKSLSSVFDPHIQKATQKIAKELLRCMKNLTPKGETGELIRGWGGNSFLVKPVNNGYMVEIVNTAEYAAWVNDGHRVKNRKGGEFLQVHNRVKVPKPHQWQKQVNDYYVFGHFFVERGILQLNNTDKIEQIIMKELQKWWRTV